jgi:two-component system sensor histidine kinase CiaH
MTSPGPSTPGAARPIADATLVRRVRWRLLAWSGGTTLAAMVILGALLYGTVSWSLAKTGEDQLRARAREIMTGIAMVEQRFGAGGGPGGPVFEGSIASGEGTPDPGEVGVMVDRASIPGVLIGGPTSGTLAFIVDLSSGAVAGAAPGAFQPLLGGPEVAIENARNGVETITVTDLRGTPVRILSMPVERSGDILLVNILGDRTAELQTLTVLLIVLTVGGLLVLAASLLVGWVYAERALVPIRDALRRQREFAADASHELRTPLAIVRGSVEDLRRNADQPVATVGSALDDIEGEVDRLTALVDDLLLLARTDSGVLELAAESTDLAEVALDASGVLVSAADRRGVRIEVDAQPVPLVADPARLRQLITILLDNAVRHAPEGSTVEVGVAAIDGSARLRVEDRGPGFRPEDLPRAFDRFWRAPDAPAGGTGLGLSIAAWIAERHGGSVTASNRPGGGARLEVNLPLR